MSDLKKKYYDGFQIHKILNEELDSGETIMRILSRFADEPSAQPDLEDIKNQALNCSAELLKLVALIGRHNKEDEP